MTNPLRKLQIARAATHIGIARRQFLTLWSAFAVLAAFSTMGVTCTNAQVQALINDIQNAISSLVNELSAIAASVGLPAAVVTTITGYVNQLKTFITGVGGTLTDTSTTTIQKILGLLSSVLAAAQPYIALLPSPLNQIFAAIEEIEPLVAAAFGIATSVIATASAKFRAVAPMSPQKASAVLAAYAIPQ